MDGIDGLKKKFKMIQEWEIIDFSGEDLLWQVIRHGPLNYKVSYRVTTKKASGAPWVMHFDLGGGSFLFKWSAVRYARKEYLRSVNEVALAEWKKEQAASNGETV